MAQIVLLNTGNITLIDDIDVVLTNRDWYEHLLPNQSTNYVRCKEDGRHISLHRLVMNCPEHLVVDHINGNGLDNRRSNLRLATRAQNQLNKGKKKDTSSRFLGVTYKKDRNKWVARGTSSVTSLKFHIGYFNTEEEAALAYNKFCDRYNQFSKRNLLECL